MESSSLPPIVRAHPEIASSLDWDFAWVWDLDFSILIRVVLAPYVLSRSSVLRISEQ